MLQGRHGGESLVQLFGATKVCEASSSSGTEGSPDASTHSRLQIRGVAAACQKWSLPCQHTDRRQHWTSCQPYLARNCEHSGAKVPVWSKCPLLPLNQHDGSLLVFATTMSTVIGSHVSFTCHASLVRTEHPSSISNTCFLGVQVRGTCFRGFESHCGVQSTRSLDWSAQQSSRMEIPEASRNSGAGKADSEFGSWPDSLPFAAVPTLEGRRGGRMECSWQNARIG